MKKLIFFLCLVIPSFVFSQTQVSNRRVYLVPNDSVTFFSNQWHLAKRVFFETEHINIDDLKADTSITYIFTPQEFQLRGAEEKNYFARTNYSYGGLFEMHYYYRDAPENIYLKPMVIKNDILVLNMYRCTEKRGNRGSSCRYRFTETLILKKK